MQVMEAMEATAMEVMQAVAMEPVQVAEAMDLLRMGAIQRSRRPR
jgi:hypothetical protein